MLITGDQLLIKFRALIEKSKQIDLASAWITEKSDAFDLLEQAVSTNPHGHLTVRVLVGISHNGTTPTALRRLVKMGELRIVEEGRLFHPKVLVFKARNGADHVWIGSANFTANGFHNNEEVMYQTTEIGEVSDWFDERWKEIGPQSEIVKRIDDYEKTYCAPKSPTEVASEFPPDVLPFEIYLKKSFNLNARRAIVRVLHQENRGCKSADAISKVQSLLIQMISVDLQKSDSKGQPIWRHRVHAAKEDLVKRGIVKAPNEVEYRIWELSEYGKRFAQDSQ